MCWILSCAEKNIVYQYQFHKAIHSSVVVMMMIVIVCNNLILKSKDTKPRWTVFHTYGKEAVDGRYVALLEAKQQTRVLNHSYHCSRSMCHFTCKEKSAAFHQFI